VLNTDHGVAMTPLFMPVGTSATVKTLTPDELRISGSQIVLANTYHLSQEPRTDVLVAGGGVAKFMGWDGPTLTDSGGFQVFSLSATRKVEEEGVRFRSVYNGELLFLTPESACDIQRAIGADMIYALDECTALPSDYATVEKATALTSRWAKRFLNRWKETSEVHPNGYSWFQAPFCVLQGGLYEDLRKRSAEELSALDPSGFAIGGLSVGETHEEMVTATHIACSVLPPDKPRHLLGVGTPRDILEGISAGVDLFDCVIPTRNGRNGQAFTSDGILNLRNSRFRLDQDPVDRDCDCYCCRMLTRSYLHHLIITGEMTGMRLLSLHNITYYHKLTSGAREAIRAERFTEWKKDTIERWNSA